MRIIVLGAGMIGSAIVRDLAQESDNQVTVVDIKRRLLARLETKVPVKGT